MDNKNNLELYEFSEFLTDITTTLSKLGMIANDIRIGLSEKLKEIEWGNFDADSARNTWESNIMKLGSYGWTFPIEIPMDDFYDLAYINNEEEMDLYFIGLYESDKEFYRSMKNYVLDNIDETYKILLEQCFICFENNNHQITIPSLLSVIEGLVSKMLKSDRYGKNLFDKWDKIIESDKVTEKVLELSTMQFLTSLFQKHNFSSERLPNINRNWILHGRDDVNLWTKKDSLKLFNSISTILFIIKMYK